MSKTDLIFNDIVERAIYVIRDQKVMLDHDLADLYGTSRAALNQAVRRNRERFPQDFMFQLTSAEIAELNRSRVVTGPRSRPYAFTELGIAMVSSVLRSKRAITVSLEIMRAF